MSTIAGILSCDHGNSPPSPVTIAASRGPLLGRPLRADAERSVRAILEAAERLLADDPSAPMEQIAEAAGLTRITVQMR